MFHRLLSLIDEDEELPSLFPFRTQDYLGFGAAILGLLLAAGGGIGGGGILVPIYILILDFPVKHAIPLASTTVLGGAIANNILNAKKKHPNHPDWPAIDWELILQLEPMTIAGAIIGVDLNKELPELVLLVLMLLLLTVTAQKTLTKASKMYQEENILKNEMKSRNNNSVVSEDTSLLQKDNGAKNIPEILEVQEVEEDNDVFDHAAIQRQCQIDAIKLVALFFAVTLLDLLQGSPDGEGGGPMGLQTCGTSCYWITESLMFICIVFFSLYVRFTILQRKESGGPILSDIAWDEHNTLRYPCLAIVAGLVAGMFGIGGGIIKGPLMLALGVHPKVASATSACMILFTSSTSTMSYFIFGFLKYDYAAFCLVLGFCSTWIGQTVMTVMMNRAGQRNSYIAYSIGIVVAISAIAMGIESAMAIFEV